jgi:hypothetical protein
VEETDGYVVEEYLDLVKEITEELRTEESADNFSAWVKLGLRTNNCSEKVGVKVNKCRIWRECDSFSGVANQIASSVIKIAPVFFPQFPEL